MAEVALAKGDDGGFFGGGSKNGEPEPTLPRVFAFQGFRADEERRVGERLSRRRLVYLDAIV